jgi:cytochrome c peroxidase
MKIKKIIHFKFTTLLVMSGIVGLFLMLFPVKQVNSADDPLITAESVRNNALAKGLKSLRVAIQEDATNDIGVPLLLGPTSPQRNVPLSIDIASILNSKNKKNARKVAAQLGKALFWDMAVGSDGQACASCHFHAGADNRVKNQLSPNLTRVENVREDDVRGFHFAPGDKDTFFQEPDPQNGAWGANYSLLEEDFPFVKHIGNGDNVDILGNTVLPVNPPNTNDVASSQGVFFTDFISVGESTYNPFALGSAPVQIRDEGDPVVDPLGFQVTATGGYFGGKVNVRRVEPRNTPTNINAVFNFHNFWDGRANFNFNGVTPFGNTDREAKIFVKGGKKGILSVKRFRLSNASLASQAVGPPLSDFEMSFAANAARLWPDIGKKMVDRFLLESQTVHPDDSLLGDLLADKGPFSDGKGINTKYGELIRQAFNPNLWDSDEPIAFDEATLLMLGINNPLQVLGDPTVGENGIPSYTLMEANFSLFFGVALMLYQAELVADDTPFDRFMAGDDTALNEEELLGLAVYAGLPGVSDGKCVNCHGGPELTNASVRNAQGGNNIIEPMIMGDKLPGMYDNGFYNISVTPTAEDLGRGGKGPMEKPLSSTRQFLFENLEIERIDFDIIGAPIRGLVCEEKKCKNDILGFIDEATGNFFPVCEDLDNDGLCGTNDRIILQRANVDGNFKTPGLRNQELQGPYMHIAESGIAGAIYA